MTEEGRESGLEKEKWGLLQQPLGAENKPASGDFAQQMVGL